MSLFFWKVKILDFSVNLKLYDVLAQYPILPDLCPLISCFTFLLFMPSYLSPGFLELPLWSNLPCTFLWILTHSHLAMSFSFHFHKYWVREYCSSPCLSFFVRPSCYWLYPSDCRLLSDRFSFCLLSQNSSFILKKKAKGSEMMWNS